jgi:hypothetical protein
MPALNTDKARKAAPNFSTQLTATLGESDTVAYLETVAELPLDTAVTITVDATDADGNLTPSAEETMTGIVNAGASTLTNLVRGLDGTTQQAHGDGANVIQLVTANDWNDFISSYLTEHAQLGTHNLINGNTVPAGTDTVALLATIQTIKNKIIDNSNSIDGAALNAGSVTFAKLLSTIFSGQVQSQANSGTAGGTIYWVNLGGIKLLWATGANCATSPTPAEYGFALPSFFTTIQVPPLLSFVPAVNIAQYGDIAGFSSSGINIYLWAAAGGGSAIPSVFAIGT